MRPSRVRHVLALTALTLTLVSAACGVDDGASVASGPGITAPLTTPPSQTGPDWSDGPVPALVSGGDAVVPRRCEVDPTDRSRALVEAVVVNTTSARKLLQGVPVAIRDQDGTVVSSETEDLWNSIDIGAGRRALHAKKVDLDREVDAVTCEFGEPDLRDSRFGRSDDLTAGDVDFGTCAPTIAMTVQNPTDRPVAVLIVVEAFDAAGFSAGVFELGQRPVRYTDVRTPRPDEVALDPGATGVYEIDPAERISNFGTPLDGPVVSCEVVATSLTEDPTTVEVIVD